MKQGKSNKIKDFQKPKKCSVKTSFNSLQHLVQITLIITQITQISTIEFSVNCLKNNNVSDFHNIKLMQMQPPNFKNFKLK